MRENHESRNNGLGCSKCSHMLVFSSHPLTPPLNKEDPSPPSSLPVPVKPSLDEDVQDSVSPSPSRIPTLTTVQQVKYQCPVLSEFSGPVDVWLRVSPLSHRCSKLTQSSSHIHTHLLRPAPTDHAATHKHIRTETLLIWQQLLGFWPLLPANHLPYSCLSHSLPLSASFSRLLLGNYSAEPSHSCDIERSVSVLPRNTHRYLKPNLSCAG